MAARKKPPGAEVDSWPAPEQEFDLVLYISGATENSRSALVNIKSIAEKHLTGRYRLAVVDLYQQPERARDQQIIAAPTLVKELPLPLRHIVGDLSSEERVLVGLGLEPRRPQSRTAK